VCSSDLVVCTAEARVLAIPHSEIRSRLESDTAFAAQFYESFATYLSYRLRSTMAQVGYGDAEYDEMARLGAQNESDDSVPAAPHAAGDRMRLLLDHLDAER